MDPYLRVKLTPILADMRSRCLRLGPRGFDDLRRKLGTRDDGVQVRIEPDKFRKVMEGMGITLTNPDMKWLSMAYCDATGYLDATRLSDRICGFGNKKRQALIEALFDALDVNHSNTLEADDMKAHYDFSQHPLVKKQVISEEEAVRQYLDVFDDTPDGIVTRAEFLSYYAGISDQCPSDEYFEEVVRGAWRFIGFDGKTDAPKKADTPVQVSVVPGRCGNGRPPPEKADAVSPTRGRSTEAATGLKPSTRIVGYSGHVPMAQERFGETFHRVEAMVPQLDKKKPYAEYYGPKHIDEANAFVRKGNKANEHSYRMS